MPPITAVVDIARHPAFGSPRPLRRRRPQAGDIGPYHWSYLRQIRFRGNAAGDPRHSADGTGQSDVEAGFDHSTFSQNRERLLKHDVAGEFFRRVVEKARGLGLMSSEHLTVDGTLIEAWASMKSFRPKDEKPGDCPPPNDPGNPTVDFHGEKAEQRDASVDDLHTPIGVGADRPGRPFVDAEERVAPARQHGDDRADEQETGDRRPTSAVIHPRDPRGPRRPCQRRLHVRCPQAGWGPGAGLCRHTLTLTGRGDVDLATRSDVLGP